MQISTSVKQTTAAVALKLFALTAWAVASVRVNQGTPEMDNIVQVSQHKHVYNARSSMCIYLSVYFSVVHEMVASVLILY